MKKARIFLAMIFLFPVFAYASTSSGMPWEGPLQKVVDSVTGPVAFGISVLAVVVAGLTLAFGGQLDGFIQKITILALVVSLIVFAVNVLSALFGVSSTLIAMSAFTGMAIG